MTSLAAGRRQGQQCERANRLVRALITSHCPNVDEAAGGRDVLVIHGKAASIPRLRVAKLRTGERGVVTHPTGRLRRMRSMPADGRMRILQHL